MKSLFTYGKTVVLAAALLILLPFSAFSQDKDSVRHKAQVEKALANMSVKEKVAQLFVVEISRNPSPRTRAYQDSLVRDYGLGNVI